MSEDIEDALEVLLRNEQHRLRRYQIHGMLEGFQASGYRLQRTICSNGWSFYQLFQDTHPLAGECWYGQHLQDATHKRYPGLLRLTFEQLEQGDTRLHIGNSRRLPC